jgi:sulfite reductase alpha subunit-like flavoprotein
MEDGDENGVDAERRLTILYASQTGNAQDLAESVARHALRQHFKTHCLSMEDYCPVSSHNSPS